MVPHLLRNTLVWAAHTGSVASYDDTYLCHDDISDRHGASLSTGSDVARQRRDSRVSQGSKRAWIIVGVALFAVADIALISLALSHGRPATIAAPTSSPAASQTAAPAPAPAPVPSPTPTPIKVSAVSPQRVLAALNSTTGWRATTGTCPEANASPELTTDAGLTWKTTNATRPTGVTALQSVTIMGPETASFIGLDRDDCSPQLVRTFVAGDNYASYPAQLAGAWYLDPAAPAVVHARGTTVDSPCATTVSLTSRNATSAAVLCADNSVHITSDAGATWAIAAPLGSTVAVTTTSADYVAAVVGTLECAGVQLVNVGDASVLGCVNTTSDPAALAGNVALASASSDDSLWLWAGDIFAVSADGGTNWG
ncbi:MAG: hypothetical protein JWP30_1691 [Homoserinimonas sp.]|jgi:hypothetical protein|nr:hypothetical protein [Homoserinimonas sp.]